MILSSSVRNVVYRVTVGTLQTSLPLLGGLLFYIQGVEQMKNVAKGAVLIGQLSAIQRNLAQDLTKAVPTDYRAITSKYVIESEKLLRAIRKFNATNKDARLTSSFKELEGAIDKYVEYLNRSNDDQPLEFYEQIKQGAAEFKAPYLKGGKTK
jgi:hypothetical protein